MSLFLTGTGTGVGKTFVAVQVLYWLRSRGIRAERNRTSPLISGINLVVIDQTTEPDLEKSLAEEHTGCVQKINTIVRILTLFCGGQVALPS